MISKQTLIKTVSPYVIVYLILLTVVIGLLYEYPKPELHMMLNSHHTGIQDVFFKYYTQLAEWPLYVLALIPLLYKKKMMTIYYALCEGTGAIFVTILKFTFRADRPVVVFENYPGRRCEDASQQLVPIGSHINLLHICHLLRDYPGISIYPRKTT